MSLGRKIAAGVFSLVFTMTIGFFLATLMDQRDRLIAHPVGRPHGIGLDLAGRRKDGTEFPAEAETLLAKAQELMARHAIDSAMVAGPPGDGPTGVRVPVDDPYAGAKSILLGEVADGRMLSPQARVCSSFRWFTSSAMVSATRRMRLHGRRVRKATSR